MKEVVYTKEQKEFITLSFNQGIDDIKTLTSMTIEKYFPEAPEKAKDGRSVYGRAVKKVLAEEGVKAKGTHEYEPVDEKLTEEDMEFVRNNRSLMSSVEMTRVLENDPSITNLHKKARLVEEYNLSLEPPDSEEPVMVQNEGSMSKYKPPKTFHAATTKINEYVLNGIDKNKISGADRNGINSLIQYLDTYRFNHQINSYDSTVDRDLFESSFVRYTYNKGDLTQEEVDQYIVLSTEVVIASNIQRRIRRLSELLDTTADDSDGRRMSMSLVDAIGNSQTEYNQCITRQQKLLESLKEKRSDKLKKQMKENASVLNLVQMWKDEESRKKMLKLANLRKESIKEEVENLSSMDEVKARVFGISDNEVLNG